MLLRQLVLIETNIDDMNPELLPHAIDRLILEGARDAWAAPIIMKKGRPAYALSVLCDDEKKDLMAKLIFEETSALGIRIQRVDRAELERKVSSVETRFGQISVKIARTTSGEILNISPEFESCKKAALCHKVPLKLVYAEAMSAANARSAEE